MPTHICDGKPISTADAVKLTTKRLSKGKDKPEFHHEPCGQRVSLIIRPDGVKPHFRHWAVRKDKRVPCPA